MLEFLSEQSKLKACMTLLGMCKTLLINYQAFVWAGTPLKLSQLGLLKEVFVVAFKANNVCSLQDHSLDALKQYADCFLQVGFE